MVPGGKSGSNGPGCRGFNCKARGGVSFQFCWTFFCSGSDSDPVKRADRQWDRLCAGNRRGVWHQRPVILRRTGVATARSHRDVEESHQQDLPDERVEAPDLLDRLQGFEKTRFLHLECVSCHGQCICSFYCNNRNCIASFQRELLRSVSYLIKQCRTFEY